MELLRSDAHLFYQRLTETILVLLYQLKLAIQVHTLLVKTVQSMDGV
jgi:hypothetical protein